MDKDKLRSYCLGYYQNCAKYLEMVLRDFTPEQLQQTHGEAKSAAELLFHAVATPHFWMKRADRGFEFRAKFDTTDGAIELWKKQLEVFVSILEDDDEVIYRGPSTIPWIMLRSCNHLIHHAGMIIYIRNILGLPELKNFNEEFGWGSLVDFPADFHYSSL